MWYGSHGMGKVPTNQDVPVMGFPCYPFHIKQLGASVEYRWQKNQSHIILHFSNYILFKNGPSIPGPYPYKCILNRVSLKLNYALCRIDIRGKIQLIHYDLVPVLCWLVEGCKRLMDICGYAPHEYNLFSVGIYQVLCLFCKYLGIVEVSPVFSTPYPDCLLFPYP